MCGTNRSACTSVISDTITRIDSPICQRKRASSSYSILFYVADTIRKHLYMKIEKVFFFSAFSFSSQDTGFEIRCPLYLLSIPCVYLLFFFPDRRLQIHCSLYCLSFSRLLFMTHVSKYTAPLYRLLFSRFLFQGTCLQIHCPLGMLMTNIGCKYFIERWYQSCIVIQVLCKFSVYKWLWCTLCPVYMSRIDRNILLLSCIYTLRVSNTAS